MPEAPDAPRARTLHQRTRPLNRPIGWGLMLLAAPTAAASLSGTGLPWDEPLNVLRENLTGPTITAIIFISIAAALATWAWSSHNQGIGRAARAVAALAIVSSLAAFFSALGINAATF